MQICINQVSGLFYGLHNEKLVLKIW